jgi:hypothetical protein
LPLPVAEPRHSSAHRWRVRYSPPPVHPRSATFSATWMQTSIHRQKIVDAKSMGTGNSSRRTRGVRLAGVGLRHVSISVQHSYYWRRGGSLKSTKAEASAKLVPMRPSLKHSLILAGAESGKLYNKPEDFVFPCKRLQGIRPLDLALVLMHSVGKCWWRWANSNSRR